MWSQDDFAILAGLPTKLADLFVTDRLDLLENGFHLRGACLRPEWHSLRYAWQGPDAIHKLFKSVLSTDVPFAEDCLGDQFLIRDERVLHLAAETGELEDLGVTWEGFLDAVNKDVVGFLSLQPLQAFEKQGGKLRPGELLSVYPPFVAEGDSRSYRAVPSIDGRRFLADLAVQLASIPDGQMIQFEVKGRNDWNSD
jgi:hypothetical protein